MMIQNMIEIFIGAVSGGVITSLLMINLTRRGKRAEVKKQEIDVDKIQDDFHRERIRSAYQQLSEVQAILDKVREELRATTARLAEAEMRNVALEAELRRAKTMQCMKALDCVDRTIIEAKTHTQ